MALPAVARCPPLVCVWCSHLAHSEGYKTNFISRL